jgi:hypothetical protein
MEWIGYSMVRVINAASWTLISSPYFGKWMISNETPQRLLPAISAIAASISSILGILLGIFYAEVRPVKLRYLYAVSEFWHRLD